MPDSPVPRCPYMDQWRTCRREAGHTGPHALSEFGPPTTPVTDEMVEAAVPHLRAFAYDYGRDIESYARGALEAVMPLVPSERRVAENGDLILPVDKGSGKGHGEVNVTELWRRVAELEEENRALKQQMTRNQVARARAALGDRSGK